MNSNKTNKLLMFHSGCHGNQVFIATRHESESYCSKNLRAKFGLNMTYDERVVTYYCSCHGKLVTIATRYVADAYCPIKPPCQIWTQYGLRQRSYNVKCI